jgi:hypothetical protein
MVAATFVAVAVTECTQARRGVDADVGLRAEMPVLALLRLMHVGIARIRPTPRSARALSSTKNADKEAALAHRLVAVAPLSAACASDAGTCLVSQTETSNCLVVQAATRCTRTCWLARALTTALRAIRELKRRTLQNIRATASKPYSCRRDFVPDPRLL